MVLRLLIAAGWTLFPGVRSGPHRSSWGRPTLRWTATAHRPPVTERWPARSTTLARSVERSSARSARSAAVEAALRPPTVAIASREARTRRRRIAALVLRRCEERAVRKVDSTLPIDLG